MSLINDALKRAQDKSPAAQPPRLHELELHPIEPAQPPTRRGVVVKLIIWIVVALVVLGQLALFMVYRAFQSKQAVAARTAGDPYEALMEAAEQPLPAAPNPIVERETAPEVQPTNIVAELERPEFHLKTIVVHPTRPSAMINNRVVFVGDRVAGYTVIAIGKDKATLKLDDDEVVVSLP